MSKSNAQRQKEYRKRKRLRKLRLKILDLNEEILIRDIKLVQLQKQLTTLEMTYGPTFSHEI